MFRAAKIGRLKTFILILPIVSSNEKLARAPPTKYRFPPKPDPDTLKNRRYNSLAVNEEREPPLILRQPILECLVARS